MSGTLYQNGNTFSPHQYTDEEMIAKLRAYIKDNHGHEPSRAEWDRYVKYPTHYAYRNHFGNWKGALSAARKKVRTAVPA